MRLFFYLPFIILFSHPLLAEIATPNYDFTLKTLENFLPEKIVTELAKDGKKFEIVEGDGDLKLARYHLKSAHYSLTIYIQYKKENIKNIFVRLPQYFNHDLLLKELQGKWKKQDKYFSHDRTSMYTWLNRDQMNILYQGSCSITCFPMFIEFATTDTSIPPLHQKFNEALPRN